MSGDQDTRALVECLHVALIELLAHGDFPPVVSAAQDAVDAGRAWLAAHPETPDTPKCANCNGTGTVPMWVGCGCGRGVKHVTDCGTLPPRVQCQVCRGSGVTSHPETPDSPAAMEIVIEWRAVREGYPAMPCADAATARSYYVGGRAECRTVKRIVTPWLPTADPEASQ